MQKKYKTLHKTWYIIPVFTLIPLIYVINGYAWSHILLSMLIYCIMSIFLYRQFKRVVAETKDGRLHFYSGVGLNDPSSIEVDSINGVERVTKKMLTIRYGHDKVVSIEAEKDILDQMEGDLKKRFS